MLKYVGLWFPMLLIAILNGLLREAGFRKVMNDLTAHQASTFTLIVFFSLYIAFVLRMFPLSSVNQAIVIGVVWLLMTLAFEFGFGRWRGNSWSKMLEDYNVLKGRLWVLIPIWVAIAPLIFYKIRR